MPSSSPLDVSLPSLPCGFFASIPDHWDIIHCPRCCPWLGGMPVDTKLVGDANSSPLRPVSVEASSCTCETAAGATAGYVHAGRHAVTSNCRFREIIGQHVGPYHGGPLPSSMMHGPQLLDPPQFMALLDWPHAPVQQLPVASWQHPLQYFPGRRRKGCGCPVSADGTGRWPRPSRLAPSVPSLPSPPSLPPSLPPSG